jgi:hypothetical protein
MGAVTRLSCGVRDYATFASEDAKNKMAAREGPIQQCVAANPVPDRIQNRGFLFFLTTDADGRVTGYEVKPGVPEDVPFLRCVEPTMRAPWGPKEERKTATLRVNCYFPSR